MFRKLIILSGLIAATTISLAIKPDKKYIRLPQNEGLIYKELPVLTEDGYKIKTWFFPAQDMPTKKAKSERMLPYKTLSKESRPTIVICNGDAGNMSYQQIFLAKIYTANGYNVVTFDWRGFGESSDFPMNENYLCYTEMLADYEAVINTVKEQREVDKKRIYLFGWSTGGYLSMITAYRNEYVAGIFAIGMASCFEEAIPQLMKVLGKEKENLLIPDDFPCEQMPAYIAPYFKKPVFLIVGSEDNRTPSWMSERIINSLPAGTIGKISVFKGAGHGGTESPLFRDSERFVLETIEFLSSLNDMGK